MNLQVVDEDFNHPEKRRPRRFIKFNLSIYPEIYYCNSLDFLGLTRTSTFRKEGLTRASTFRKEGLTRTSTIRGSQPSKPSQPSKLSQHFHSLWLKLRTGNDEDVVYSGKYPSALCPSLFSLNLLNLLNPLNSLNIFIPCDLNWGQETTRTSFIPESIPPPSALRSFLSTF